MTHNAKYLVFKRPSTRATIERIARARRWTLEQAGEEAAQLLAARECVETSHSDHSLNKSKNGSPEKGTAKLSAVNAAAFTTPAASTPIEAAPGKPDAGVSSMNEGAGATVREA